MRARRWDAVVVAVLAAVVGSWCAWGSGGFFVDLEVYRMGGAALGGGDLYRLALPGEGLPFTYPPFAAVLAAPVAALPLDLVVALWSAAGVLALGVVVARVLDLAGVVRRPLVVPGLVVLGLAFEPVWSTFSFGQVNLFLLALVVADLARPRPSRWDGVGVGLAAAIKLTPLALVPYLVLTGRRRAAGVALATFAATVLVGLLADPAAARDYWTRAVWDSDRVGGLAYAGNQSVLGVLARLGDGRPPAWLWIAVAGPVALAALLVGAALHRRGERALGLCLAGTSSLLASPISWNHHWVWAVPTTIALWAALRHRPAWLVGTAVAAWAWVFVSACIWWGAETEDAELGWSLLQGVPGNGYVVAALALLAACAAVVVAGRPAGRRGRDEGAAPAAGTTPSSGPTG